VKTAGAYRLVIRPPVTDEPPSTADGLSVAEVDDVILKLIFLT